MLKGRALWPIGRRTKTGEATLPKRSRLQHGIDGGFARMGSKAFNDIRQLSGGHTESQ
jgi:hypothetical protein